jgi:hypothetical protein
MADRGVPSIFEVLRKSGLNVPSMKVAGVIIAGVVGFFSNFNRMFG